MAFENVQYTAVPLSRTMGLLDLAMFVAAPGFIVQMVSGDTSTAAWTAFAAFLMLAAVIGVRRHISLKRSFAAAKQHLAEHGIKVDLEFARQLAIDSSAGKVAFVTPDTMSYQVYDRADILGCEHQWVTKSDTGGRLSKTQNVLVFKTRNAQQPLYKIRTFDHATGELWLARMNAILNS